MGSGEWGVGSGEGNGNPSFDLKNQWIKNQSVDGHF